MRNLVMLVVKSTKKVSYATTFEDITSVTNGDKLPTEMKENIHNEQIKKAYWSQVRL